MTEVRRPLVSVMMPCYNAERTLPMALASLLAQTYGNWEAVVVDDGSTDGTWALLEACRDPRVRRERFPQNRGRGAARQRCLELARGELLSFLDSDDWLFPEKLERQAALMAEHPELAALSVACVITDAAGAAVGMSRLGAEPGRTLTIRRLDRPGPPQIGFPSCMVRMEAARAAGFDPVFRRAQDKDFLIRALLGREYGICAAPLYAYSQAEAASLAKTLEAYRYRLRLYGRYLPSYPISMLWELLKTLGRMVVFGVAGLMNAEKRLIERRWGELTPEARQAFERAKADVAGRLAGRGA